jgi:peroxiredoxin
MTMQKLSSIILASGLAASAISAPSAPWPRKSPEFTINEPGGKTTMLSSFKGKVVAIEFLFLGSERCLRVAMTMNRLYKELGPRGFQPIGVAFGPKADAANTYLVAQSSRLSYPFGYTSANNVDTYLARGKDEVLNIPQVVVIDRAGMIRAQSGGRPGDPKLENEDSLRTLLDGLLKEKAPPDGPNK